MNEEDRPIGYGLWKRCLRAPWEVPAGCFHVCQALEQLPNDEALPEEPGLAFSVRVYDGHLPDADG